jgi:hypothetical protein
LDDGLYDRLNGAHFQNLIPEEVLIASYIPQRPNSLLFDILLIPFCLYNIQKHRNRAFVEQSLHILLPPRGHICERPERLELDPGHVLPRQQAKDRGQQVCVYDHLRRRHLDERHEFPEAYDGHKHEPVVVSVDQFDELDEVVESYDHALADFEGRLEVEVAGDLVQGFCEGKGGGFLPFCFFLSESPISEFLSPAVRPAYFFFFLRAIAFSSLFRFMPSLVLAPKSPPFDYSDFSPVVKFPDSID